MAGIIYGGLTALAQQDMKKLIAYSSVGHMGFVTLGIFALNQRGLEGALHDDQPRRNHRRAVSLRGHGVRALAQP